MHGVFSFQIAYLFLFMHEESGLWENLSNHLLKLIHVIRMPVCPRLLTQGDSCDERGISTFAKMMYFSDGILEGDY